MEVSYAMQFLLQPLGLNAYFADMTNAKTNKYGHSFNLIGFTKGKDTGLYILDVVENMSGNRANKKNKDNGIIFNGLAEQRDKYFSNRKGKVTLLKNLNLVKENSNDALLRQKIVKPEMEKELQKSILNQELLLEEKQQAANFIRNGYKNQYFNSNLER